MGDRAAVSAEMLTVRSRADTPGSRGLHYPTVCSVSIARGFSMVNVAQGSRAILYLTGVAPASPRVPTGSHGDEEVKSGALPTSWH